MQTEFVDTIKSYIRVGDLPFGLVRGFSNPERLVMVTINDVDQSTAQFEQQKILGSSISSLAAPSESDKRILSNMSLSQQQKMYELAILKAVEQPGRKITKAEIKAMALKLPSRK